MPTVVFEPNPNEREARDASAEPLVVPSPDGGALVDVCDAHHAPIPFSCKSANCGTCRIDVFEGLDQLLPAADEELDLLDIFGASKTQRLACQAKMKPGLATLRIRAVSDEV